MAPGAQAAVGPHARCVQTRFTSSSHICPCENHPDHWVPCRDLPNPMRLLTALLCHSWHHTTRPSHQVLLGMAQGAAASLPPARGAEGSSVAQVPKLQPTVTGAQEAAELRLQGSQGPGLRSASRHSVA